VEQKGVGSFLESIAQLPTPHVPTSMNAGMTQLMFGCPHCDPGWLGRPPHFCTTQR
jgi:hypothetical protein